MATQKRSSAPKVVNFSFGLYQTPQKKVLQKNAVVPSRVSFFDASNNKSNEKAWQDANNKFHDLVQRKTFHSGAKQAKTR